MKTNISVSLQRDCVATMIPAGDEVTLEKGTSVYITQALGGSVTVRSELGLFRIAPEHVDVLGLDKKPEEVIEEEIASGPLNEAMIWDALKQCFDPEIPINIVDLGLIYDLAIEPEGAVEAAKVYVKMTLTAQGCGMGPTIAADAKDKIERLGGVEEAQVDIVWDPVWNPEMISDAGRKTLGLS